jgi:hypothetical protein
MCLNLGPKGKFVVTFVTSILIYPLASEFRNLNDGEIPA